MKVLFYTPMSIRYGGGCENWFSELAKLLINKHKIKVGLIDTNFIPTERWNENEIKNKLKNVDYKTINESVKGNILLPKLSNLNEIAKISENYNLIYFNFSFIFQDILMYLVKKITKKPVICGIHAPLFFGNKIHDFYVNLIAKKVLKKFDAIHVLNETDRNLMSKWDIKKIFYIPSGSNTDKFKMKEFVKIKKLKLLFVGRLAEQKGIGILVNAIKEIYKTELKDKIEFNIVGSGELKRLIDEIKDYKNVNYYGFVKDIAKEYQKNDILLMPSKQETFGLTITEANSCGLPVISSKIPGPDKLIIEGKNGWFLKEITYKELTNKIIKVYDLWNKNPKMITQMGKFGREFVIKNYSTIRTAQGFKEMFLEELK